MVEDIGTMPLRETQLEIDSKLAPAVVPSLKIGA